MSLSADEPRVAIKARLLCLECVEDNFLRAEIEKNGHDGTCFYCELDGKTFSIDQLANFVETALSQHFWRVTLDTSDDTDSRDEAHGDAIGDWAGPSTHGQPVIELVKGSAGINEPVAKDILRVLAERHRDDIEQDSTDYYEDPFDDSTLYARLEPGSASYDVGAWRIFEKSIKTEGRFFNRSAEETLKSMFQAIAGHRTIRLVRRIRG